MQLWLLWFLLGGSEKNQVFLPRGYKGKKKIKKEWRGKLIPMSSAFYQQWNEAIRFKGLSRRRTLALMWLPQCSEVCASPKCCSQQQKKPQGCKATMQSQGAPCPAKSQLRRGDAACLYRGQPNKIWEIAFFFIIYLSKCPKAALPAQQSFWSIKVL